MSEQQMERVEPRIAALAIRREERTVRRHLTPDQIAELREKYTSLAIEYARLDEEFKLAKADHKGRVDPILRDMAEAISLIRNRYRDSKIECYLVDDQDRGMMEFFDANGEKVDERRLFPEERQTNARFSAERSE